MKKNIASPTLVYLLLKIFSGYSIDEAVDILEFMKKTILEVMTDGERIAKWKSMK